MGAEGRRSARDACGRNPGKDLDRARTGSSAVASAAEAPPNGQADGFATDENRAAELQTNRIVATKRHKNAQKDRIVFVASRASFGAIPLGSAIEVDRAQDAAFSEIALQMDADPNQRMDCLETAVRADHRAAQGCARAGGHADRV